MINIKFNKLKGEGFNSLGQFELDFSNLGTCLIQGVNNYDSKTGSNGSGKSSLIESISWCLFGKTSKGISKGVINKFYKRGCYVELHFEVEGTKYIVRRAASHKEYKTGVLILKEGEDISAKNKTDSDKLILQLLSIDLNVFSQYIYLSQGFSNRFAIYAPKARKELLENMYGLDNQLGEFIENIKLKQYEYDKAYNELQQRKWELDSIVSSDQRIIESLRIGIENYKNDLDKIKNFDFEVVTEEQVTEKFNEYKTYQENIQTLSSKMQNIRLDLNTEEYGIRDCKKLISSNEKSKHDLSTNQVCPYCGTILQDNEHDEHIQEKIKEIDKTIADLNEELKSHETKANELRNTLAKMEAKQNSIKSLQSTAYKEYEDVNAKHLAYLEKDAKIKTLESNIEHNEEEIKNCEDHKTETELKIPEVEKDMESLQHKKDITSHILYFSSGSFKSYLLGNIVNMLNEELASLSEELFENEIIKISGDDKLDILLDDKEYEQLSGGEQRKVDIAIIIAQRNLAQQMNAISSNILILDEIFDGLDDIAFNIVLDLLIDRMEDVESTLIISHRDIKDIPFDNLIKVIKNENQVSEIN